MTKAAYRIPVSSEQALLDQVTVRPLSACELERARYAELIRTHHYLKSDQLVGEQLRCVAESPRTLKPSAAQEPTVSSPVNTQGLLRRHG